MAPNPATPHPRPPLRKRLHALWRHSIFNPYRLDGLLLRGRIAELGPSLSGLMLDVGCGERPYAPLLPNVRRYVGIEHLAATINVEQRFAVSIASLNGIVDAFAGGEALPFRAASFDSLLCTEVLEHVPDPETVAAELARVLKPGGRALITVPFVGELHQTPYDFRRFTVFGIQSLLERHGFEVERLLARGNFAATAGRVLAHAIYRLGGKRVKRDGAVQLHLWAMPIVLPLCALVTLVFGFCARFTGDESLCLGYAVLARRRNSSTLSEP